MAKLRRFDIVLDNPTGIYRPGDMLSGQVIVSTAEDIPVNGIHLWVLGQADVTWFDKNAAQKTRTERQVYMKDCFILWGRDPRERLPDRSLRLPAGSHEYSFSYPLPRILPSTFQTDNSQFKGTIQYLLHAKVDSTCDSDKEHRERAFLVLANLDLNNEKKTAEMVQLQKAKKLHCCCCKLGQVSCALRLDRTGYVPGEDINLDAEIHNNSRKEILTSHVTMQQITKCRAERCTRSSTSDIFRISGGKIKSGDSAFFHDIIHIPPLPPSRLTGCRLLDIEYVISVSLQPADVSDSLEITVPIIIGTLPHNHVIPPGVKVTPSFSRYSHSSGEIEDYCPDDYKSGKVHNVYVYYKSLYKRIDDMSDAHVAEIT